MPAAVRREPLASVAPSAVAPTALSEADLRRLRASLMARARDLVEQDVALRQRLTTEQAVTANTFVAGTEGACAAAADDQVIALLHHEQDEMREVRQALLRLDEGRYGWCAECGDAIGLQRLAVLPEAALCVSCQGMAEHRAEHRVPRKGEPLKR
ncbi:MAG: TraR/DksA family transcriptional regulator [Burkholderiales bacterium]|nr:TraR/DksA family transcriptional regulator [Burkholderiales bacterium]MBH2016433.1 TraR/DksA family transcriptional regulator [Burkholderiales bacterium]